MNDSKFRPAYNRSKADAKRRKIEFLFTFEEWRDWWISTGKWDLRGRRAGCYQMCRLGDAGPYSPQNVYCDTIEANSRLPHVGASRPKEWKEKIANALRRKPKSPSHLRALAFAALGKQYATPFGVFITAAECEAASGVKRNTVMWRCKNNYQNQWTYV